jgi:methionine-R-sulfoxide reductase
MRRIVGLVGGGVFASAIVYSRKNMSGGSKGNYRVTLSDDEWKKKLSPQQFHVLREKGTERAFTGEYESTSADGVYECAGCGAVLYRSGSKFHSGCGWPAFYDNEPGAVERHTDTTLGMSRTEIVCSACGGHLGHVFRGEGYKVPTNERHCVNSVSLRFKPA